MPLFWKSRHYLSPQHNPSEPWLQKLTYGWQVLDPKVRWVQNAPFKIAALTIIVDWRAAFIHRQPAGDSCRRERSGANVTSAATNQLAPFSCWRWASTVAGKLRAMARHMTCQTSAVSREWREKQVAFLRLRCDLKMNRHARLCCATWTTPATIYDSWSVISQNSCGKLFKTATNTYIYVYIQKCEWHHSVL